jgi:hypothetical protein
LNIVITAFADTRRIAVCHKLFLPALNTATIAKTFALGVHEPLNDY